MNGPTELHECARCGWTARAPEVRLWWANVAREAVEDRRPYAGPMLAQEFRCRDQVACRSRVARTRDQEAQR